MFQKVLTTRNIYSSYWKIDMYNFSGNCDNL